MIAVKSATSVNTTNESQGTLVAVDSMKIGSPGNEESGSAAAVAAAGVAGAMGLGNNVVTVFEYNNRAQDIISMEQPTPLLTVARKVNSFWLNGTANNCTPFVVDDYRVGLIMPNIMEQIIKDTFDPPLTLPVPIFKIVDQHIEFSPWIPDTYEGRSLAIDRMLRDWRERNLFSALRGWREECFEVASHFDNPHLFKMERSATFLFGIRKYGVDINGFVRHPTHGICIWLQKRAVTKQTWPGYWDNLVGGGLSSGHTVLDTACKEAQEEASVPTEVLKSQLKAVGTVSYFFNNDRGLSPNTEFVFDLELPLNFNPFNSDGEVDEFNLVTAEEALRIACGPDFKTTSCPVIIDFLIRHGLITEESEPNLLEVKKLFNVPLETFYYRENKSDFQPQPVSAAQTEQ